MTLHLVGYWRSDLQPALPDPKDLVDVNVDERQRRLVQRYLERGTVLRAFRGWSTCRICKQVNGSQELTDGALVWPEGLAHYVRDHQVRLPMTVEQHILASGGRPAAVPLARLADEPVSLEWWAAGASSPLPRAAPSPPPGAPKAREPWRIALPLVLMVTPMVHLALGADGGYFWFYLSVLLLLAAYLGLGLLRR